jgi:hypothetical protein
MTSSFAAFPLKKEVSNISISLKENSHQHQHTREVESQSRIAYPIGNLHPFNKYKPYGYGPDGVVSGALALTFGIWGILVSYAGIGLIFVIPALIFGIVGSCSRNGTAIAGLILGAIGLLLCIMWLSMYGLWFLL